MKGLMKGISPDLYLISGVRMIQSSSQSFPFDGNAVFRARWTGTEMIEILVRPRLTFPEKNNGGRRKKKGGRCFQHVDSCRTSPPAPKTRKFDHASAGLETQGLLVLRRLRSPGAFDNVGDVTRCTQSGPIEHPV